MKCARIETPASVADKRTLVEIRVGEKLSAGLFVFGGKVYINLMNPQKDTRICIDEDVLDSIRMSAGCLREKTKCEMPVGRTDRGLIYLIRDQFKSQWLTSIRVCTEKLNGGLIPTRVGVSMVDATWKGFSTKYDDICKYPCFKYNVIIDL